MASVFDGLDPRISEAVETMKNNTGANAAGLSQAYIDSHEKAYAEWGKTYAGTPEEFDKERRKAMKEVYVKADKIKEYETAQIVEYAQKLPDQKWNRESASFAENIQIARYSNLAMAESERNDAQWNIESELKKDAALFDKKELVGSDGKPITTKEGLAKYLKEKNDRMTQAAEAASAEIILKGNEKIINEFDAYIKNLNMGYTFDRIKLGDTQDEAYNKARVKTSDAVKKFVSDIVARGDLDLAKAFIGRYGEKGIQKLFEYEDVKTPDGKVTRKIKTDENGNPVLNEGNRLWVLESDWDGLNKLIEAKAREDELNAKAVQAGLTEQYKGKVQSLQAIGLGSLDMDENGNYTLDVKKLNGAIGELFKITQDINAPANIREDANQAIKALHERKKEYVSRTEKEAERSKLMASEARTVTTSQMLDAKLQVFDENMQGIKVNEAFRVGSDVVRVEEIDAKKQMIAYIDNYLQTGGLSDPEPVRRQWVAKRDELLSKHYGDNAVEAAVGLRMAGVRVKKVAGKGIKNDEQPDVIGQRNGMLTQSDNRILYEYTDSEGTKYNLDSATMKLLLARMSEWQKEKLNPTAEEFAKVVRGAVSRSKKSTGVIFKDRTIDTSKLFNVLYGGGNGRLLNFGGANQEVNYDDYLRMRGFKSYSK